MFQRVLIANRGEIAQRILRACAELGIESVVIHSEADRDAPWLAGAGRTICVGPPPSADSYLNQDAVLQAAEQADCQAIHPGYGFLAENALFAARCSQQGITFVGPTSHAIRLMGNKSEAKRTMASCGLTTIPGSDGALADLGEAVAVARKLGYPVLLKPSAGGGGKGMRLCENEKQLEKAFPEAGLEAEKAFGDPTLYLEKQIVPARHIEFQVLCDAFGKAVHLGERECSIQRQHQKLIEESPSPVVDEETRRSVGRGVAQAVAGFGYVGAGTVEFLRGEDGSLYFMEMNTRLQVEHPVTEMLTATDIVVEQLRIAANERLRIRQEEVRFRGHAIEFRVNAEDPANGFRPDPGRIDGFAPPRTDLPDVELRWDSAVREGYRIPPYYDSLIGKLIVRGKDREETLTAAEGALASLRIEGVRTTLPLHLRVLGDAEFRAGRYDIGYLERNGSDHG